MIIKPEQIMKQMLMKGFPDLLKESITLNYYRKRKDCFFEYASFADKTYSIDISDIMKNCPIAVFKGGLGHELSHIARARTENKTQLRLYKKYREYRTLEERETDLETIIRGYGKELMEFLRFIETIRPYKKDSGLSATEAEMLVYPRK